MRNICHLCKLPVKICLIVLLEAFCGSARLSPCFCGGCVLITCRQVGGGGAAVLDVLDVGRSKTRVNIGVVFP